MSTSQPTILTLLQDVQDKGKAYRPDNPSSQNALYRAAQKLANATQDPVERVAQLSWHVPTILTAIRVAIDMRLFEKMVESTAPKSVDELAKSTDADVRLIERFLKHLATSELVVEVTPDTYAANSITKVLADPRAQGMFIDTFEGLSTINSRIVNYFRQPDGFKNPTDKDKSIFMFSYGVDIHYFQWLNKPGNDERLQAFLNHMKIKTLGQKWFETVNVQELLGPANEDEVLLVDVGGAAGQDLQAFHAAFPDLPGRLILQDKPAVIQSLDPNSLAPIEAVGYDFFQPQPVKGARGYYLKMVLHDWPDSSCQEILKQLKPALVKGQSKILLNEAMIPEMGAGWYETGLDMLMMLYHSAHERREREWRVLIEGAGLKVTKIFECGEGVERLIVVELP